MPQGYLQKVVLVGGSRAVNQPLRKYSNKQYEGDGYTFRGGNFTIFAFLLCRSQLLKEKNLLLEEQFFPKSVDSLQRIPLSGEANRN